MKNSYLGLLCALFLSLAIVPVAYGEDAHLSDVINVYGQGGGELLSYDRVLGQWVRAKAAEPAPVMVSAVVDMLPDAIPALYPRPLIAIVIDDVGVDLKRSARTVKNLTAPVTLSYLPYAAHIQQQVETAKAKGHEVILHLPWEPDSEKADPGPNHLSVNMPQEQIQKNLLANLEGFTGYAGVNNHMGSRFSRYRPGLEIVMAELKKRNLFFLDSKTTPDSIAEKVAREYGISSAHRDVFLDHDENSNMVRTSLQEVEDIARRKGSVIAIGHPKDVTLNALEPWLASIEAKGFQLVPLSAVISYRQTKATASVAHLEHPAK